MIKIYLASPIKEGNNIELSLVSASNIADQNGGILQAFPALQVENRVREAPSILSAETSLDGTSIALNFDKYIDETSLPTATFFIEGNTNHEIASVTLMPGEVDAHISKRVLLTLNEALEDTSETLSVQYISGEIHGLYAGTLEPGDTIPVINQITVERFPVTLIFEDGSESLSNLYVNASWKVDPIPMYDDGSRGDAVANDHIWTYFAPLVVDRYSWDVFERKEHIRMDTIRTVDPITGVISLTITPVSVNEDSMLSENILLAFSVANEGVSGDTVYGIQNRDVIFNLQTTSTTNEVFLMGIDGDWANGQFMAQIGSNSVYADTLFKMTAGDVIEYNYRIGNDWENLTPEPRRYVVKNGDNFIKDQFGVFTGIEDQENASISIYPNPSKDGFLNIESIHSLSKIHIYNSSGKLIRSLEGKRHHSSTIDLSHQSKGLYILKFTTSTGQISVHKILLL